MEEQINENKSFKLWIDDNNVKIRTISNIIGTLLIIAAGLYFVLIVDLRLQFEQANKNVESVKVSVWLFMAILFALGGGILYFFGDSIKHKKNATIIVKGLAIALSACFIGFLQVFSNKVITSQFMIDKYQAVAHTLVTTCTIITIVALVGLIFNYVFSIIYVEEDY